MTITISRPSTGPPNTRYADTPYGRFVARVYSDEHYEKGKIEPYIRIDTERDEYVTINGVEYTVSMAYNRWRGDGTWHVGGGYNSIRRRSWPMGKSEATEKARRAVYDTAQEIVRMIVENEPEIIEAGRQASILSEVESLESERTREIEKVRALTQKIVGLRRELGDGEDVAKVYAEAVD